jgi:hypothetical protein
MGLIMSNAASAQFQFHKPVWLYESLPFLYLFAGALALIKLDGGVASISGVLLILAGSCVLQMRRNFRRAIRIKARHSQRFPRRIGAAKYPGGQ